MILDMMETVRTLPVSPSPKVTQYETQYATSELVTDDLLWRERRTVSAKVCHLCWTLTEKFVSLQHQLEYRGGNIMTQGKEEIGKKAENNIKWH